MQNEHVLSGLAHKRTEIVGHIEHTQSELRRLVTDLDAIDAAIRIFDPTADVGEIKGVTYTGLVERLKAHGFEETEASITMKLKRGTFAATFLFACLAAL